mgnify:FL=1
MFQIASMFMRFMGSEAFWKKWYPNADADKINKLETQFGWVETVYSSIMTILVPILAIVAAAGIVWSIVLGVQMARADSSDKREEVKKRLIGLVVGIAILVVLILFFTTLFPVILQSLITFE